MYLDLIFKMADYISKKYAEPSSKMVKSKFYKRSAECFALENVLKRCFDNPERDPIEVLDNLIFKYSVAKSTCVQQENKYLYLTFINALTDVKERFD